MEVMEKLPNDGKSPLWHIEKRMVMDPNYHFPDRHTLNRMYAIISMDRDICLHTKDDELLITWYSYCIPQGLIANGNWKEIEFCARMDMLYDFLTMVYQQILKDRDAA